jgi:hypothetical protein
VKDSLLEEKEAFIAEREAALNAREAEVRVKRAELHAALKASSALNGKADLEGVRHSTQECL